MVQVKAYAVSADGTSTRLLLSMMHEMESNTSEIVWALNEDLQAGETLVCEIDGENGKDRTFYKHGALPLRPTAVTLSVNEKKRTITVSSETYAHAVTLTGEAVFEDNCFSLLPGESRTISYQAKDEKTPMITAEAYTIE
jgi:hypothetical protein